MPGVNEAMTSYRETPAPPALAHWVECYWEVRARSIAPPIVTRILPDGSADLVFHLGDVPVAADARTYLVGTLLTSFGVRYARNTHVIGACLRGGPRGSAWLRCRSLGRHCRTCSPKRGLLC